MPCRDANNCDATKTILTYDPIPVPAEMWDEGDIITFEADEIEISEHTNHTGTKVIRSAKQVKWVDVTVQHFPCSPFYKMLYAAWLKDTMICGNMMINEECCSPKFIEGVTVKKMGIKPVSFETEATEVVYRGRLLR